MKPELLVVFDYSGVLSIAAPRFARPECLNAQLRRSGLADVGIDSPGVFWDEIVNPAWEEGGLTGVGYARLIARRAAGRLARSGRSVPDQALEAAARRFVSAYLAASAIHFRWHPLLHHLTASPRVQILIATDHYAEATGAILNHLAACRCRGIALGDLPGGGGPEPGVVVVANSADLGAWKNERSFWERVQAAMALEAVCQAVLVEDFGAAEQEIGRAHV